ncbi:MAG: hypothetical protein H6905_09380 [Hyphomicrobiales bacterium]|nr:hypothetical protein [Hyphomicrobiales bacterium]
MELHCPAYAFNVQDLGNRRIEVVRQVVRAYEYFVYNWPPRHIESPAHEHQKGGGNPY